ncbi:MAG: elongator complex protein 3 [Desulfovibrio sp.]
MHALGFAHPDPLTKQMAKQNGPRLRPVFLPFAGCPHRCVFCGQQLQTGEHIRPLETIFADLHRDLLRETAAIRPDSPARTWELAFYGGTFTALPAPWPERFLELASKYRAQGLLTRVRCSTRPDRTDPALLARFRRAGLDMVELGIQSFDPAALAASGRGYDGETAQRGCENVREAGLELGIQLMPGLPGDQPGLFQEDVERCIALRPDAVRLYPCLVIQGTPLAQTWRAGGYAPWSLERTRQELAPALLKFWRAGIPVIRIGLHPEPELLPAVLDGPWHPALGQMIRSLALCEHIRSLALPLGNGPKILRAPRRFSGELMGHGRELWEAWKQAGITIAYDEGEEFLLARD